MSDSEPANFFEIAFSDDVRRLQERYGSRRSYARAQAHRGEDRIGPDERAFLESRDDVYLASVTDDGWPYVQFRGGPPGFLHTFDDNTIAFADVRGNRQYVTTGNLASNDRIALIAVDYPEQARLKLFARAEVIDPAVNPQLLQKLSEPRTSGVIERLVRLHVVGYDWNCPQHITPRWSLEELRAKSAIP